MKTMLGFWVLAAAIYGGGWVFVNYIEWMPVVVLFVGATLAGLLWPVIRRER